MQFTYIWERIIGQIGFLCFDWIHFTIRLVSESFILKSKFGKLLFWISCWTCNYYLAWNCYNSAIIKCASGLSIADKCVLKLLRIHFAHNWAKFFFNVGSSHWYYYFFILLAYFFGLRLIRHFWHTTLCNYLLLCFLSR